MSGHSAESWKLDRIGSAERGENPTVIARMPSGFVVLGDTQFLPGYCLLLRTPRMTHLTDLSMLERIEFLRDMSLLGEAIEAVCEPLRINYEIAGNIDSFVHAHVIPRYDWEPSEYLRMAASHYPADRRNAPDVQFSPSRHTELQQRLSAQLDVLVNDLET